MAELLERNTFRLANVSASAAKRFGRIGVEAIYLVRNGLPTVTYETEDIAGENTPIASVDATTEMIRRHSGSAMLKGLDAHD